MTPREWLRAVSEAMPGKCSENRVMGMQRMAEGLLKVVPQGLLKPYTAKPVGQALKTFPTLDELATTVARVAAPLVEAKANGEEPDEEDAAPVHRRYWLEYAGRRLGAGANRAHILSLCRTYASPAEFGEILRAHYREEWHQAQAELEERRRDQSVARLRTPDLRLRDGTPRSASKAAQVAAVSAPGIERRPGMRPETLLATLESKVKAGQGQPWMDDRIQQLRAEVAGQAGG